MTQTFIPGKDAALEDSIARFQNKLQDLGFNIEEASWLNPVPMSGQCISATAIARSVLPTARAPVKKRRWPPRWASISSVSQLTIFC